MDEETEKYQGDRALAMYLRLARGQVINKEEEATKYGVSTRTIGRDLEVIKDCLSDWQAETGEVQQIEHDRKRGGHVLVTQKRSQFTNSEILALSKILLESRAFTKKEMDGLMEKLLACCVPRENYQVVKELILNEQFHYVEPHHKTVFMDKMWDLAVAIMFSEFYFYLVGFILDIDKEKAFQNPEDPFPTIYRIDRIQSLEVTEERFRVKDSIGRFEEGEFRKRIQFMQGGKLRKIKFKYKGNSLEAVLDRLPTAEIVREEDDGVVIVAEVFGNGIDMWLRMHEGEIEWGE